MGGTWQQIWICLAYLLTLCQSYSGKKGVIINIFYLQTKHSIDKALSSQRSGSIEATLSGAVSLFHSLSHTVFLYHRLFLYLLFPFLFYYWLAWPFFCSLCISYYLRPAYSYLFLYKCISLWPAMGLILALFYSFNFILPVHYVQLLPLKSAMGFIFSSFNSWAQEYLSPRLILVLSYIMYFVNLHNLFLNHSSTSSQISNHHGIDFSGKIMGIEQKCRQRRWSKAEGTLVIVT